MNRIRLSQRDGLRLVLVLGAASLTAALVNGLRPDRLAWITPSERTLSYTELKTAGADGRTQLVDARSETEFRAGHLAHAINIPSGPDQPSLALVRRWLSPEERIVIYGKGNQVSRPHRLARFLIANQFDPAKVLVFEPGWEGILDRPEPGLKDQSP